MLVFVLGAACIFALQKALQSSAVCRTHYDLLNPEAACIDRREGVSEWEYEPLRLRLIQAIEIYTTSGTVPRIALYFRDLHHGSRFAIRANEKFEPVSLLKLPIMMVILHEADRHLAFLDERLTYEKEDSYRFITGSLENTLQLHSSYTIRELLEKMIQYSDNSSAKLLLQKIDDLGLLENSNTFADFGTMKLLTSGELDNTHLILLVNIFVALYNANYLSKDLSQLALNILTHTNFETGIVGGVPADIRVAHKYGIRVGSTLQENELHDCGTVYHPSTPYVLCILTAGADPATASAAIRDISKIIYENVDTLNR